MCKFLPNSGSICLILRIYTDLCYYTQRHCQHMSSRMARQVPDGRRKSVWADDNEGWLDVAWQIAYTLPRDPMTQWHIKHRQC
ncbi:hypothetical protein Plhal304r1_c073g0161571 [Plasmopara halstedii]